MPKSSKKSTPSKITYADAGVDIAAGNELVERIKDVAKRTRRPEVMSSLGGFGALCEIPSSYRSPVLVSGTDGVGTKLKLAMDLGVHDTIGIDLVAMCVNDIVVTGAEPLQFLDYYATGKLDPDMAAQVVAGIGKGCELAGCALVGGETAEMPGMYKGKDYDLAGFCVGVVEKNSIIEGAEIRRGDRIIGLASSGIHSNGYSLVRKILKDRDIDPTQVRVNRKLLSNSLLEPTRIYVKPILKLMRSIHIKGMAHITGGGLLENIPRALPSSVTATIDRSSWKLPPLFTWLQKQAQLDDADMFQTFNCGIGMILIVSEEQCESAMDTLSALGETAIAIGQISMRAEGGPAIEIH